MHVEHPICLEFPVRMGTSSICMGRAVRTRITYVGIGHAKKCVPYLYNARWNSCMSIGRDMYM